jgi:CRP/FNR family cyclic AMP-dependent transcriptional regulator
VKSIWRMTTTDEQISPDRAVVTSLVQNEVERLVNYAVLDGALSTRLGSRQALLAAEVRLLRARAEKRMFRLLGLVYPRESIERAWVHYRNPDRRIRSNAIELLDTTIDDPELRVVVAYAESTGYQSGRSQTTGAGLMAIPAFTRAMSMMADTSDDGGPIDALLARTEPWLREMHAYALRADRLSVNEEGDYMPSGHDDVMEKLFLLRGVELFNQVPADQLLPLAELAGRGSYAAGSVIFNADDPGDQLYVVVSGEVIIERDGQTVATLGRGQAFGEMAILDDAPRSATVRVDQTTECLLVSHDDFGELLDIAPGLARGVMRVLTMRLRNTLERLNS